jgi:hypothetical protein
MKFLYQEKIVTFLARVCEKNSSKRFKQKYEERVLTNV